MEDTENNKPAKDTFIYCDADVQITSDGKCSSLRYRDYDKCHFHKIKELESNATRRLKLLHEAEARYIKLQITIVDLEAKLAEAEKTIADLRYLKSDETRKLGLINKIAEERNDKLKVAIEAFMRLYNDKSPPWDSIDWKYICLETAEKLKA